jgi:hypothetical protein
MAIMARDAQGEHSANSVPGLLPTGLEEVKIACREQAGGLTKA